MEEQKMYKNSCNWWFNDVEDHARGSVHLWNREIELFSWLTVNQVTWTTRLFFCLKKQVETFSKNVCIINWFHWPIVCCGCITLFVECWREGKKNKHSELVCVEKKKKRNGACLYAGGSHRMLKYQLVLKKTECRYLSLLPFSYCDLHAKLPVQVCTKMNQNNHNASCTSPAMVPVR
jgi:hypothetical protein